MDNLRMAESTFTDSVFKFCRAVVAVFWPNLSATTKLRRDNPNPWDFLGCLLALIACIGLERIARLLGKGCTKAAMGNTV
jgi:hypothetical protein